MVDGRWLLVVAVAVMVLGVSLWGLWPAPKDPEQLFRDRCSSCHKLPDLSGYRRKDIRSIVTTMLEKNGANAVITPAEAARIIAHLEEVTPP